VMIRGELSIGEARWCEKDSRGTVGPEEGWKLVFLTQTISLADKSVSLLMNHFAGI